MTESQTAVRTISSQLPTGGMGCPAPLSGLLN
jgi:hypothetical protein